MEINDNSLNYTELAWKVLAMLRRNTGRDADDEKRSMNRMVSGVQDHPAAAASESMTVVDDHLTLNNWEWPTGVALYSMYKFAKRSGDREFYEYLLQWYDTGLQKTDIHKNVNTVAPMLALVCLYEDEPRPQWRAKIQEWVDWIMLEMPRTTYGGLQHMTVLNRHYQQLWDDTLFMTVLFLAKAGKVFGCDTWVEEARYQFLIHIKYLQDKLTGLFYHGWTFDYKHNFANVFWGRGNSWFTAGAVEFLEICAPARGNRDAVSRYVLSCLEDQVKELVKHQGENGLFTTLLDSEESYSETSATANIAYGILKGVRLGLLDAGYAQAGRKAARAVIGQISADGTVQGVSYGTGMGSTADCYRKIPLRPTAYGQGLCLMMLSELV